MDKTNLVNLITMDMYEDLSTEQMSKLKDVLYCRFSNLKIEKETYELAISDINQNQQMLKMFVVSKASENISKSSLKKYRYTIQKLMCHSDKLFTDMNTFDLKSFVLAYKTQHNISDRSANNMRLDLSTFFGWMQDNEYITKNPMKNFKTINYEKKIREIISNEEKIILKDGCRDIEELALVDLLLATGMRVGEVCNLKIENVDLHNKNIKVYGKGNKWRTINLNSESIIHLQEYIKSLKENDIYLFQNRNGDKSCTNKINKKIRAIKERVGITKEITVHTFRRTFLNDLRKSGVGIELCAEFMGHTNPKTTIENYVVIDNYEKNLAYDKCFG